MTASVGYLWKMNRPAIGVRFQSSFAAQVPLEVKGAASQTGSLIRVVNSAGSTLWSVGPAGLQNVSITSTATALGSTYPVDIALTASATGIVSGNAYALRAITTLSGTITGGAFVAGVRCGVVFSGTMNHADSRVAGLFVKLDDTGATETTGQMSVLWVDHGAGITGAHGGQFNMIRITDTVAGSKGNAVIYAHANATNYIDLSAPGGVPDFFVAAGTGGSSAGASGGGVAAKVLKCSVGGVDYWLPLFSSNS